MSRAPDLVLGTEVLATTVRSQQSPGELLISLTRIAHTEVPISMGGIKRECGVVLAHLAPPRDHHPVPWELGQDAKGPCWG
jgi:hypothetical protein